MFSSREEGRSRTNLSIFFYLIQNMHLQPIIIRISSFLKAHHSVDLKSYNRRFGHLGVKSLSLLVLGSDLRDGIDDWRAAGRMRTEEKEKWSKTLHNLKVYSEGRSDIV